ncbi:Mitochondrial 2-oxoadipate and 2-oxoglutarate transporter [Datura stramonium]|uniref:Mitochondrial 2-oxoadipate and 2-oxoglutarate transporter n=1 Tax=Datura stramonium TaxID=4076 RepID=A0ABS8V058_DATST|nr:Mitochondrial 2-oxoadipate and 2-oxoglutarate transporter [Datura stramonium]
MAPTMPFVAPNQSPLVTVAPCAPSGKIRRAIAGVRDVFDVADYLGIPKMQILNIGGGFRSTSLFEEIATVVKEAVEIFPDDKLTIIAEPGRFFPETAFTLVTHVIGKRVRGKKIEYWIDDGIYGSFRPTLYNSCFVVAVDIKLVELQMDDLIVFYNMGAYSKYGGTRFNGFDMLSTPTYLWPNAILARTIHKDIVIFSILGCRLINLIIDLQIEGPNERVKKGVLFQVGSQDIPLSREYLEGIVNKLVEDL